jgi:hypothetical protein
MQTPPQIKEQKTDLQTRAAVAAAEIVSRRVRGTYQQLQAQLETVGLE